MLYLLLRTKNLSRRMFNHKKDRLAQTQVDDCVEGALAKRVRLEVSLSVTAG